MVAIFSMNCEWRPLRYKCFCCHQEGVCEIPHKRWEIGVLTEIPGVTFSLLAEDHMELNPKCAGMGRLIRWWSWAVVGLNDGLMIDAKPWGME
jgi:hypothetical protein